MSDGVRELRAKGYFLLPLPARSKEPPPTGWPAHPDDYQIPADGNVAIGTRGELAILITNDDRSTSWATGKFGTPNVRSRRGAHWYLAPFPGLGNLANATTDVGTMEVHVSNKYALVPPSIHPSGVPYSWERELPPAADLPVFPDVRELWRPADPAPDADRAPLEEAADAVVTAFVPLWKPGVRWQLTRALAGVARKYLRLDEAGARALAQRVADGAGDRDPLDREDKIGQTYSQPDLNRVGVGYWLREAGHPEAVDLVFGALSSRPDDAVPMWIPLDAKGKPCAEEIAKDWKASPTGFVVAATRAHRFAAVRQSGDLLVYDGGRYVPQGDVRLREWIEQRFLEDRKKTATTRFCSEVVDGVRRRSGVDMSALNPPDLLCMRNGVLNPVTLEFTGHTPDVPFTYRLDTSYDREASAPTFQAFLAQILPEDSVRESVLEVIGDTLDTVNRQKSTALVGAGSNGKTTLCGVIEDLHGDEAVSNVPLQALTGKFEAAELYGKRVNISNEMPPKEWLDSSAFKALTGGDRIYAQRKFGQPFKFVSTAKLIVKTNELPPVSDQTFSFGRRWNIINFPVTIEEDAQDASLPAKLRAELPGILNLALAALGTLRARGRFATPGSSETMEKWRQHGNGLTRFIGSYVIIDATPAGCVRKDLFYGEMAKFCADAGLSVPREADVTSAVPRLVPGARIERRRLGGGKGSRQVPCWVGFRIRGHLDDADGAVSGQGEQGEQGEQPSYLSHDTGTARTVEGVRSDSKTLAHPTHPTHPPSVPVPARVIHAGCALCPESSFHVCYACDACLAQGAKP